MSITDARLREMMNASVPGSMVWELASALIAAREKAMRWVTVRDRRESCCDLEKDRLRARLTEIGAIAIDYADGTTDAPVEATDWNRVSALADGRA